MAVAAPTRSPLLPDVPTIAEMLPGYKRDGSHVMLAPAGTPRPILNQISNEVRRIFELPDVKERLKNFDYSPGADHAGGARQDPACRHRDLFRSRQARRPSRQVKSEKGGCPCRR